ncbi:hypothetical protein [Nocardia sp. SSK8]|uniref:hypothetical protein n=1 Tax=Nocardia sp. SSK8 TaxID=3120154 RepID=UPI00300A6219
MTFEINAAEWAQVASRAAAGELALDPEVGKNLERVCDDHLDVLREALLSSDSVSHISGFGPFNSSKALEKKFSLTGSGGDRSLDAALKQHIDTVLAAKEAIVKGMANYRAQDTATHDRIAGAEGQL